MNFKLPEMEEIFADTGLPVGEVRKRVAIGTPVTIRKECMALDLLTAFLEQGAPFFT